jgi:hypothetical protein
LRDVYALARELGRDGCAVVVPGLVVQRLRAATILQAGVEWLALP